MHSVQIPELTPQLRKLENFPKIAKEVYSGAMRQTLALSEADIAGRAPVLSGRLKGSISGEIKFAMGDEVRGVMHADARASDGFPYGYALDGSPRYHRRGTKRKTRRFFKGVIGRKRKVILALFERATAVLVERLAVK
jgi:hypothetical protein